MKVEIKIDPNLEEDATIIFAQKETEEIKALAHLIQAQFSHRIIGTDDEKVSPLQPSEIQCFYTENQKVFAKTVDQTYSVKERLYQLEELLPRNQFIRISNSVIANKEHMKHLSMSFGGTLCIQFKNGDVEYSSRRYVAKIKKSFGI